MKDHSKPNLQNQDGEQLSFNLEQPGVVGTFTTTNVAIPTQSKTKKKLSNKIDTQNDYPEYVLALLEEGDRVDIRNGRYYIYRGKAYKGMVDESGFHPKKTHTQVPKDKKLEEILYGEQLEEVRLICKKISPSFTEKKEAGLVYEVGFTIAMIELLDLRFIKQYEKRAKPLSYCIILHTSPLSFVKELFDLGAKIPKDYSSALGLCDYYLKEKTQLGIQDLYLLMGDCYIAKIGETTFFSINEKQREFCQKHNLATLEAFYMN